MYREIKMKKTILTLSILGIGLLATGCTKPAYVENNISRLNTERRVETRDYSRVNEGDGDYIKGNSYVYGGHTNRDGTGVSREARRASRANKKHHRTHRTGHSSLNIQHDYNPDYGQGNYSGYTNYGYDNVERGYERVAGVGNGMRNTTTANTTTAGDGTTGTGNRAMGTTTGGLYSTMD